ncbi:MAG: hypothetical protein NTV52_31480 [Acidobacteria bacterium]|nr:hypothetical protein [Acidobacteriota bacterium]
MKISSILTVTAALVMSAGLATAAEKTMMHCFAFTPIEPATDAEWKAFYAATDALPKNIPAIKMVWAGKLRGPLATFTVDPEARKKLVAGEKDVASTKTNRVVRSYGACFAMEGGPDALKAYTAAPYHKVWMAAYEKVRVAGTTTYDILAQ